MTNISRNDCPSATTNHSNRTMATTKKTKRIMANRQSARESYQRKKKLMATLQDTTKLLAQINAHLEAEHITLHQQVVELKQQLRSVMMESKGGAGGSSCSSSPAGQTQHYLQSISLKQQHHVADRPRRIWSGMDE